MESQGFLEGRKNPMSKRTLCRFTVTTYAKIRLRNMDSYSDSSYIYHTVGCVDSF